METKNKRKRRHYDQSFKLEVIKDYYESGCTVYSLSLKYGIEQSVLHSWIKKFASEELSLPSESNIILEMAYKSRSSNDICEESKSVEDELREEISRLRQALKYSELRNEALHEVLKLGKEKYGVDLLKNAGAKQ